MRSRTYRSFWPDQIFSVVCHVRHVIPGEEDPEFLPDSSELPHRHPLVFSLLLCFFFFCGLTDEPHFRSHFPFPTVISRNPRSKVLRPFQIRPEPPPGFFFFDLLFFFFRCANPSLLKSPLAPRPTTSATSQLPQFNTSFSCPHHPYRLRSSYLGLIFCFLFLAHWPSFLLWLLEVSLFSHTFLFNLWGFMPTQCTVVAFCSAMS